MNTKKIVLCTLILTTTLAGCGGGGGDDAPDDASSAGIWTGTVRIDGQTAALPMTGVVTETGEYAFVASGSSQRLFFGTGSTNGTAFNSTAVTYLNGTRSTPASIQGTVAERSSINGSYSTTGESASFTLSYQTVHDRTALAGTLQGVYSSTAGITSIAVIVDGGAEMRVIYPTGCFYVGIILPSTAGNYYRSTGNFLGSGCGAAAGSRARALIYLTDLAPGQNNQVAVFIENLAQDAASFVLATK